MRLWNIHVDPLRIPVHNDFLLKTHTLGRILHPMELTKNPANRSARPHLHYLFRAIY